MTNEEYQTNSVIAAQLFFLSEAFKLNILKSGLMQPLEHGKAYRHTVEFLMVSDTEIETHASSIEEI